jgi:hypothetical protein
MHNDDEEGNKLSQGIKEAKAKLSRKKNKKAQSEYVVPQRVCLFKIKFIFHIAGF